ncbi:MAG: hypothetical protein PVG53_10725 [Holophagae bacterium]
MAKGPTASMERDHPSTTASLARWATVGFLIVIVVAMEVASRQMGFQTRVPWFLWQLLDRNWLLEEPIRSVWLLHSQPPLLNLAAAVLAGLSESIGCSEDALAGAVMALVNGLTVLVFFDLAKTVTARRWLAGALTVLLVAQPAYWVFRFRFFYPFLLLFLFLVVLWCLARFLTSGRRRWLAAGSASLLSVHLLRSLYPPIFGIVLLVGCLLMFLKIGTPGPRQVTGLVGIMAMFIVLGALWPLKNALVFGQWTFSSWKGYNLARGIPISKGENIAELRGLAKHDECPTPCQIRAAPPIEVQRLDCPAQVCDVRTAYGLNGNHYAFLLDGPVLQREAVRWRLQNPSRMPGILLRNYAWVVRPTFIKPYGEVLDGPRDSLAWQQYARSFLEPLHRSVFAIPVRGADPIEITVLGLLLPFAVIAAFAIGGRQVNAGEIRGALLLLSCWILLWQIVVVTLTDAQEGNRMRVATLGMAVLIVGGLLGAILDRMRPDPGRVSGRSKR